MAPVQQALARQLERRGRGAAEVRRGGQPTLLTSLDTVHAPSRQVARARPGRTSRRAVRGADADRSVVERRRRLVDDDRRAGSGPIGSAAPLVTFVGDPRLERESSLREPKHRLDGDAAADGEVAPTAHPPQEPRRRSPPPPAPAARTRSRSPRPSVPSPGSAALRASRGPLRRTGCRRNRLSSSRDGPSTLPLGDTPMAA